MVHDISVLIGGPAGEGINSAGMIAAQLLNHRGYSVYMYYDYPSLIRGGHNFAIIRGTETSRGVHRASADYVVALNQETMTRHSHRFGSSTVVVSNADMVRQGGQGIPVKGILLEENAPAIMGNSAMIGAFAKAAGVPWDVVLEVFRKHVLKGTEKNLAVARRGYDAVDTVRPIPPLRIPPRSLITGNEAIGLGLAAGGLSAYISYPMTPSSGILHFLAENAARFGITVVHPENEIAVILMALGFSYAGKRAAAGTSGGGFCLMTEGISCAGMTEVPVVVVVSQRTGPSTGLPTYTAQSDLSFVLHAGQGEFPRLVVAPGDAVQAYFWAAAAVDIAWRFQVPAFLLSDKTLSEGLFSIDPETLPEIAPGPVPAWDGVLPYRRYAASGTGVSPPAFPGTKGAVVKVNSYAHDEDGITTEDAGLVSRMAQKRVQKGMSLSREMGGYPTVDTAGSVSSELAVICWGSVRGVCAEVCADLALRMVQPVVMEPFPAARVNAGLKGVARTAVVEENTTGQLAALLRLHGIPVDTLILHSDGRPLTPGVLKARLAGAGI